MSGLIRPLIWEVPQESLAQFAQITELTLPNHLYDALAIALGKQDEDGNTSLPQRSLELVMGWLTPELAFLRRDWTGSGSVLRFFFLGEVDAATRKAFRGSLLLWLAVTGARKADPSIEARLMEFVEKDANWKPRTLSVGLQKPMGGCISPDDPLVFDLVTQGVARFLAQQELRAAGASLGRLTVSGHKGSPYDGRDLFLLPLNEQPTERGPYFWSEVVRVSAANMPESPTLRLVASLHMRNYGPLSDDAIYGRSDRRLDVFFSPSGATADLRHGEIPFRVHGHDGTTRIDYEFQDNDELFKLLRTFGRHPHLDPQRLPFEPVGGERGMWILPRLGRVHGDNDLPAGQGFGWGDRDRFAFALDEQLSTIGLNRIGRVKRTAVARTIKIGTPWEAPSQPLDETGPRRVAYLQTLAEHQARRRALISKTLAGKPLRILQLAMRDTAPQELLKSLAVLLGPPARQSDLRWEYSDGLVVELLFGNSGVLAELLPARPEATAAERARLGDKVIKAMKERHQELVTERAGAIASQFAIADSWSRSGAPWITLVELKGKFRSSRLDPYRTVYDVVSRLGGLPQAVLVTEKGMAKDFAVFNALKDGVRMIGAAGLDAIHDRNRPDGVPLRLVGLWAVRRNAQPRTFPRRDALSFPIVVKAENDTLQVAMLDTMRQGWRWMSYAEAGALIGRREVPKFAKMSNFQRSQLFSNFYREVLESLNDDVETIVLSDATNIRKEVDAFSNKGLRLGRFSIAGLPGTPLLQLEDESSSMSIVRFNSDPAKRATYSRIDAKNFTEGTFREEHAIRTFWAIRKPSMTITKNFALKAAMRTPRRLLTPVDGEEEFDSDLVSVDRGAPMLEEISILLRSRRFDFETLGGLVRKLRRAHVSWSEETVLPYPLHEAQRLENHLK